MRYLVNAFSLAMLASPADNMLHVKDVSASEVEFDISAVGHQATAEVLAVFLGRKVIRNRVAITLMPGDVAYIAQLQWPDGRPPEGAVVVDPKNLPPVKFIRVRVFDNLGGHNLGPTT